MASEATKMSLRGRMHMNTRVRDNAELINVKLSSLIVARESMRPLPFCSLDHQMVKCIGGMF